MRRAFLLALPLFLALAAAVAWADAASSSPGIAARAATFCQKHPNAPRCQPSVSPTASNTPAPSPTPTPTLAPTATVTATPIPSPTPTSALDLPRIPWEGGPAYWSQFPKAHAAGWDDPSFFPISVFLSPPAKAAALKALGINTYMGLEHNAPLTTATGAGMFVLPQRNEWTPAEVGDNPNAVGWFVSDECEMGYSGCTAPDEAGRLAQQQAYVDQLNGYADGRFKQANFGNGILRTWWAPNTMSQHVQLMDAASADKYAYTSPSVDNSIVKSPDWPAGANPASSATYGWQADQMRHFQDPAHLRPVWTFVETKRPFLNETGARSITPDQIEGAVWSAIIHEARGVAFFQHNNDPSCGVYSLTDCGATLQDRVTALTGQIRSLAPVLNSQSYSYDFANGTDTMLKTYNGDAYIFADVGLLDSTGSKTFTLPAGIGGSTVTVVGENRTIPVVGGSFTDTFDSEFTHHIYRITLQ